MLLPEIMLWVVVWGNTFSEGLFNMSCCELAGSSLS